ncbi:MAG TPA: hypothetical protein VH637_11825 [Streptosporangiaceae bacterium]
MYSVIAVAGAAAAVVAAAAGPATAAPGAGQLPGAPRSAAAASRPPAAQALAPPGVFGWGDNEFGQVGTGSVNAAEYDSPVAVTLPASTVQVAASPDDFFSAAVLAGGTLETWGNNTFGQVGDATTTKRYAPFAVPGLSHIIQVAVGGGHVLALDSAGTVWSWGNNTNGQLGNGTTSQIEGSNPTPVPVPGLHGIVQITAGDEFSMALRGDGSVWVWGRNNSGQLGDGTTVDRDSPEQLPALTGLVSRLIAGEATSYAIRTDGTLLAWGDNSLGLLGKGTSGGFATAPAQVPGLTGVTQVASAAFTTLAVTGPSAAMWAWGSNTDGESGDGTTTAHLSPEQTSLTGVARVAAGRLMSAAVLSNGNLLTWGQNSSGELGAGTHDSSDHPAPGLVRTLAGVSQVALSFFSGLAIGSPAPRIPSLIGDTQAGAAADLQAAGYVLGRVTFVVDITCEYIGEVKAQNPVAGTLDPPGTSVAVTIGKAPGKCL